MRQQKEITKYIETHTNTPTHASIPFHCNLLPVFLCLHVVLGIRCEGASSLLPLGSSRRHQDTTEGDRPIHRYQRHHRSHRQVREIAICWYVKWSLNFVNEIKDNDHD